MKILAIVTLLLTLGVSAQAGTGWAGYYSNYVGTVAGTVFSNGPVFKGSYTQPLGRNGAYANLWMSYGPDGSNNAGDEVDYTIGRVGKLGKLEYDCAVIYYDMGTKLSRKDDFVATGLGLSLTKSNWKPSLWMEYDFSTQRSQCPSGFLTRISFSRPVGKKMLNLSVGSHPWDAFGIKAQAVSFVAAEMMVPTKQKDLSYFVRGQLTTKSTSRGGMADNAVTMGFTQGF